MRHFLHLGTHLVDICLKTNKRGDKMFIIFLTIYIIIAGMCAIYLIVKKGIDSKEATKLVTIPISLPVVVIVIWMFSAFFNNKSTSVFILFVSIFGGYIFLRLGIEVLNKIRVKFSKVDAVYIRDVDVEYSPAVLSYLQNQKLEPR